MHCKWLMLCTQTSPNKVGIQWYYVVWCYMQIPTMVHVVVRWHKVGTQWYYMVWCYMQIPTMVDVVVR